MYKKADTHTNSTPMHTHTHSTSPATHTQAHTHSTPCTHKHRHTILHSLQSQDVCRVSETRRLPRLVFKVVSKSVSTHTHTQTPTPWRRYPSPSPPTARIPKHTQTNTGKFVQENFGTFLLLKLFFFLSFLRAWHFKTTTKKQKRREREREKKKYIG